MSNEAASASLRRLGLAHGPVAISMVDRPPAGIQVVSTPAISSCAFWRRAENEVFYATAEAHRGCAVGAHVMGLPMSVETRDALGRSVALMSGVGYLRGEEVANIPQVRKAGSGVVYGPLAGFPLQADCVLVWVEPAQAMLLGETLHTTAWKSSAPPRATLMGRPACGALAHAINDGRESFSLGCAGMRSFTEIAPALALFVIPGEAIASLADRLTRTLASNAAMLEHYRTKNDAFA
jgi:uncharacterized protein (DUF169 family)